MEKEIRIFVKSEAYPIGDVFGIISVWNESDNIFGELYFTRENDQDNIFKLREKINCTEAKIVNFDMKNDLFLRMDSTHKVKNLSPESIKVPAGSFNPYDANRFKWTEFSVDQIYQFLDLYSKTFDTIYSLTQNKELKEKIDFSRKIKSMFTIEEF